MLSKVRFNLYIKKKLFQFYWFQNLLRRRIRYKIKIKRILRNNSSMKNLSKNSFFVKDSRHFLKENFNGYRNINWHLYYAAFNNILKDNYIPEDLYFTYIEPTLNKQQIYRALQDKNSYNNHFKKTSLPKTIFKLINGEFFDENNNGILKSEVFNQLANYNGKLVFKPAIMSGGGKNVIIDFADIIIKTLRNKNYERSSYIIQKQIVQHPKIAKFHPKSVNTCRVLTARIESEIVVLSAYFRIGKNDSIVDNGMAGGLMSGINKKGEITDFAFDFELNKIYEHPNSEIKFKGFVIPGYNKVQKFCIQHHKKFLHNTLISWDIAISESEEPIFIEFNLLRQAISGHQLVNGPLFGKHTEYLLKKYRRDYKKNFYYA